MKIKRIIATVAIIAVIVCGIIGYAYYLVIHPQVKLKETAYIYIYPTDSTASIIEKIEQAASPKSNMHTLYRRLVSNQQTPIKVTIPSTRTVSQLVSAVCKQIMIDSLQLSQFAEHPGYYSRIGYTKETLPTLFIPNTYEFYWDVKPERFMIRMMNERRNFWNESRRAKAEAIGLTIEEVMTLASIVDEETNNDAEKPIVAGLYINRLKQGMLLQADLATESPYNTYKYKGLPPGPIRIASVQGIESVLNYQKHNYIYMCAKEDFSGTHNFATTLAQHNANARRYQQALNKRNIKQ